MTTATAIDTLAAIIARATHELIPADRGPYDLLTSRVTCAFVSRPEMADAATIIEVAREVAQKRGENALLLAGLDDWADWTPRTWDVTVELLAWAGGDIVSRHRLTLEIEDATGWVVDIDPGYSQIEF